MGSFMVEKPALAFNSPSVPNKGPIFSDHSMTRNDDRYPVHAVCPSYRADCLGISKHCRLFLIAGGRPKRYRLKPVPHPILEIGSRGMQGNAELPPGSFKIFSDLLFGSPDMIVLTREKTTGKTTLKISKLGLQHPPINKFQKAHTLRRGTDKHRPKGGGKPVNQQLFLTRVLSGGATGNALECIAKPTQRLISGAHGSISRGLSSIQLDHCLIDAIHSLVGVVGHTVIPLKPPAHVFRRDSSVAQIRIGYPPA